MPFPYRDPKQAESFALGYFERLRDNDDIRRTWLGLDALVQVCIQEPEIAVFMIRAALPSALILWVANAVKTLSWPL